MRLPSSTALVACAALAGLVATGSSIAPARAAVRPANAFPTLLTRAQAAGRINALLLRPASRPDAIRRMSMYHAMPARAPKKAKVTNWLIDGLGYIWGMNKSGKVLTYHDDCVEPGLGRVDHAGNLLVACMVGQQFSGVPGNINLYKAGNTSAPADAVLTDAGGYIPFDVFEDNGGNIYAVNAIQLLCGQSSCSENPGNIVRWSIGNQATGDLPDKTYADANLYQLESADIDAGGTMYVDGFTAGFTPEVDSLSGSTATDLNISLDYPGGMYVVSPNGSAPALSVLDQAGSNGPTLYQFGLPILPSASPIVTDSTPQNFEHSCDPVGAGYSPGGADASLGLEGCKANAQGTPANGQWTVRQNLDYVEPFEGLFVPSDK
jgi:hypothetical protein